MGYSTNFSGWFDITPPLEPAQVQYLMAFAQTRRMSRDAYECNKLTDPLREAVGLLVGPEGGYFVNAERHMGQDKDSSILDYNEPPSGQPGLWCQWIPSEDGTELYWDGGEKFYYYVEWLRYLLAHFLFRWDRKLNGEVTWQGEEPDDMGRIIVKGNRIYVSQAIISFPKGKEIT